MKTEKEKMLAGELYNASDPELVYDRLQARLHQKEFNDSGEDQLELREEALRKWLPNTGEDLCIQPPFFCDYGYNLKIGHQVFFNFNCVVLDVMPVLIGDRSMFGPHVQIYTATHPMNASERAKGLESARPISIGEDVWVGGNVVICPGVTIGDRSVIGAGSVVTKDIPSDVFAAGNPCRVIRQLNE